MAYPPIVIALIEALGADVVSLRETIAGRRWADWSGEPADIPLALLRPRSTAQLSEAMSICTLYCQPVVVQGGLTGLAGGACTRASDVAISLERMTRICEVDPVSATLTAEAGATLESVQNAAAEAGLTFPFDLGARGSCTIGGNLATNAGGNRVIKYGMARDQVLGLEAVLANGDVIDSTHKMVKNNTGYDLRNLMIGSEGTLGIITRVVLRLRPPASAVATAWCGVGTYESVTGLLSLAQRRLPTGVSAFEVMWPSFVDYMTTHVPDIRNPLDERHNFHVLMESVGTTEPEHQEVFQCFLEEALEEGLIENAALAQSKGDAAEFWRIRDSTAEFPVLMPDLIAFDVSFSIADIGRAAQECDAALRNTWPTSTVLTYGHLGDGNLHLIVQVPGADAATVDAVENLVYGIVRDYRGSVSAEHGIGSKKRDVLGHTRSVAEIAAMRAIKAALDPHNILNPDKVLPA
nr:FAD-binding oxidoreductase [Paraburkholderia mimosarum]